MVRLLSVGICGMVCAIILSSAPCAFAAPTADQRQQLQEINVAITKAGNLFKAGKFKESADVIKNVQERLDKLSAGGKDLQPLLEPLFTKLERAHALLELEGVDLPPLKRPAADAPADKPANAGGAVSFVKDIAPLVITRCGRCHVDQQRGRFSMANYESLMKGIPATKVVFPKDPDASLIIDVLENAKMPPNGNKLPDEEIAKLKKWIAEGAVFDGKDEKATLASLAPNAKPAEGPKVELSVATGKETISFARDIAPVLTENCKGCHGGGRRASGNFNLVTFQGMLRGGDSGPPVTPGKPGESLLVKKILGMAGDRMPKGRDPLSADAIAKIEKWVQEGCKFDGGDPNLDVERVYLIAKAQRATHDELSADRAKLADDHWRLGMPSIPATKFESRNFLVLGNVGENTLKDVGETAEGVAPKVATILKIPADDPLIKGRMTLFVFGARYDYSEFGQMIERRELPKEWKGHWNFNITDAYGAVISPRGKDYSLEGLIGQQLAGTYVASLGKVPRWFAEGSARVVASKVDGSDSRVIGWNDQIGSVVSHMEKADDFLTGKLSAEESDVASFSFVSFLMKDGKSFQKMLDTLRKGTAFDAAFSATYNGSPAQVAELWVKRAATAKPSKPARTSAKK